MTKNINNGKYIINQYVRRTRWRKNERIEFDQ